VVLALLDLAKQCPHGTAFRIGQLAKSLLLLGCPFPGAPGMTPLVQPLQAELAPALSPLLDAVQVHPELVRRSLKRQPLAQPQNSLRSHPRSRVWVENAHLTQHTPLVFGQFQVLHRLTSAASSIWL